MKWSSFWSDDERLVSIHTNAVMPAELAVLSIVTDTLWRLVAEVQTKHAEWAVPAGSTGVLDLP